MVKGIGGDDEAVCSGVFAAFGGHLSFPGQWGSFFEYRDGGSFQHSSPYTADVGLFEVYHNWVTGRLTFVAEGADYGFTYVSWAPTQARMYSVINTAANQMPGATFAIETFSNAHIGYEGSFHEPFNGTGSNPNYNLWGLTIPPGGVVMGTWEKKCTT